MLEITNVTPWIVILCACSALVPLQVAQYLRSCLDAAPYGVKESEDAHRQTQKIIQSALFAGCESGDLEAVMWALEGELIGCKGERV